MPTRIDASEARRWFAEDLRVSSPVLHNPAVIEAFAKVPREDYLGNGPWRIHSRLQIGAVIPALQPHFMRFTTTFWSHLTKNADQTAVCRRFGPWFSTM